MDIDQVAMVEGSYKCYALEYDKDFFTNALQMPYKCLTNVLQISYKCLTNAMQLNMMRNVCIIDWQHGLSFILSSQKISAIYEAIAIEQRTFYRTQVNLVVFIFG